MQVLLPEELLPARLTFDPESPVLSDDEYFEFCRANPDARFERTAKGEIVIVPPAGAISDFRNLEVSAQLRNWSKRRRNGMAFGPTAEFILPNGAALSPDAAWVSSARLANVTEEQLQKFPPVCPEFVLEVMSPSDRLKKALAKMNEWMANGVEYGLLIDGKNRALYIFRAGIEEPEKRVGERKHVCEGPVAGLKLDLTDVWRGSSVTPR